MALARERLHDSEAEEEEEEDTRETTRLQKYCRTGETTEISKFLTHDNNYVFEIIAPFHAECLPLHQ